MPDRELTDEEQSAILTRRREMAQQVADVISRLERLADTSEAKGDAKTAAKLRLKIPTLERKRTEILDGRR